MISGKDNNRLLQLLPIPPDVTKRLDALILAGEAAGARPGRVGLGDGWGARRSPIGGTVLFDHETAPRRWAQFDRNGTLHAVLRWQRPSSLQSGTLAGDVPLQELAWARVRVPGGGWLEIEPGSASHPIWGRSDRLIDAESGKTLARLAAQDYGRLSWIPPVDHPAAIPAGGGEAVINLLAALMADQGRESVKYRGPYPTHQLFDALCRSFTPTEIDRDARERFCNGELSQAWAGEMEPSPVRWAPRPWEPLTPAPGVEVRLRAGDCVKIDTVWVGRVPFRRAERHEGRLPCGERVWIAPSPGKAAATRYHAGLVMLGEPYKNFLTLDGGGNIIEDRRPTGRRVVSGPPLTSVWHDLVFAWSALHSTPPLASSVMALRGSVPLRWAALPLRLAHDNGNELLVNSGLANQYRRLLPGHERAKLGLLLISDVLQGLASLIRARARMALERRRPVPRPEALTREARRALTEAGERVAKAAPLVLRAVAAGEAVVAEEAVAAGEAVVAGEAVAAGEA